MPLEFLFAGTSLIPIIIGIYYYRRANKLAKNGMTATGEVTGFTYNESDQFPIIRFTAFTGQVIEGKTMVPDNKAKVGDKINVYYDQAQPSIFTIDPKSQKAFAGFFFIVGIILLAVFIILKIKNAH